MIKEHTCKFKTKLEDKLKCIFVEKVRITLTEEESICSYCNTPYEVLGEEVVHRELQYVPASVKVIEYVSVTYICPQCKWYDVPYILKSNVKGLMKHSLASLLSVAWVMYQKHANALPLYLQEKDWSRYVIEISRTILTNWITYCS